MCSTNISPVSRAVLHVSVDIIPSEALLMESLKYVQAYIDDLLCISRESFDDHLDKLEEVLRQLRDAGLKVNADKSTFCALEIEYLGYILCSAFV